MATGIANRFSPEELVSKIRHALQGAAALLVISSSTIVLTLLIVLLALFKWLAPEGAARNTLSRWLSFLGECWVGVHKRVLGCYRGMQWDVQLPDGIDHEGRYLVFCNHQSWVDVLVLQNCLNRRAPFMRFLLKQKLIWVPVMGVAWWALDMAFLRRYSRQDLLKNPSLRGKDLENAARACEKLKHIPVSMMAFPEGTRFTPSKHVEQKSPYQHLLLPRYGGIGQVLYSFDDALKTLIDVTISYPGGTPTFWEFISGQVPRIWVSAVLRPIDAELRGKDFNHDPVAKRELKTWLNGLWAEKDKLLAARLMGHNTPPH